MPKMDYSKLLGRIKEKKLTQESLADAVGISRQQMNNKLTGRSAFKQKDIKEICLILEIPLENVGAYFFSEEVALSQQKEA